MVDRLGSLIVRNLTPGPGYRFEEGTGPRAPAPPPSPSCPRHSTPHRVVLCRQHLHAGLNYVRMRDGILLAATVRLPPGKTLADGPVPDGHRVLRLQRGRAAQPDRRAGGPGVVERSAPARHVDRGRVGHRPAAGLRDRERADAGHGLLGRRLRPVRAALRLRRLRHRPDRRRPTLGAQPQGRHGRHLLLGVLPAGRGRHRSAGPGGHHAAQPDRRPLLDRLSRAGSTTTGSPPLDRRSASRTPRRRPGRPAVGQRPRSPRATRRAWPTSASICRPRASSRWSAPTSGAPRRCSTHARRRLGLAHHRARLPGRRARGRAGRPAVARPHRRPAP